MSGDPRTMTAHVFLDIDPMPLDGMHKVVEPQAELQRAVRGRTGPH